MKLNSNLSSLSSRNKIYIILFVIVLVGIMVNASSNSGTSNGSTPANAKKQKLDSLLAAANSSEQAFNNCLVPANKTMVELNKLKVQMNSLETAGDTSGYNALVPHQNELVELHNKQVKDCDAVGDVYYAAKASYNNYLDDIQHGIQ